MTSASGPTPAAGSQTGATATSVLLVGEEAGQLASRLSLSGYRPHRLMQEEREPAVVCPGALILAAEAEGLIPELRQRFPGVPLLLGVSSDSLEGRVRCLRSGADDFWITSLGPSDLLTRLRLHLGLGRRAGAALLDPAPASFQVADLSVCAATREVRRGQRRLSLTAREYDLLLLLVRSGGAVVSRDTILRTIWNEERAAASNVIEVYVRYLRQKLEQGGERRLIHTVRGRGYCLADRLPGGPGGSTP